MIADTFSDIYGLIRIATDDAGSYPWLILRQIRECVTLALIYLTLTFDAIKFVKFAIRNICCELHVYTISNQCANYEHPPSKM